MGGGGIVQELQKDALPTFKQESLEVLAMSCSLASCKMRDNRILFPFRLPAYKCFPQLLSVGGVMLEDPSAASDDSRWDVPSPNPCIKRLKLRGREMCGGWGLGLGESHGHPR